MLCRSHFNELINKVISSDLELVFIGTGRSNGHDFIVEEVHECRNISDIPKVRFYADPLCIYEVYKRASSSDRSILLLAHSHPAPPEPSLDDLYNMRTWAIPWLIISSSTGESKAWIFENEKLIEINIEIDNC